MPRSLNRQQAKLIIADSDTGVWTRARYQSDRSATTVTSARTLRRSLKRIEERYGEVLIEQIPPGRAVTVIVVAPEKAQPRVLPLLEGANDWGKFRALVVGERGWSKTCAAAASKSAVCALRALDCKDLARVDLRCTSDGLVTISRVLAIEPFSSKSAAQHAMALAGLAPADMATIVMQTAIDRWRTRVDVRQPSANVTSAPVNMKRATTCNISASSATA